MTLLEIVTRLRAYKFECEGGYLENCTEFRQLEKLAELEETLASSASDTITQLRAELAAQRSLVKATENALALAIQDLREAQAQQRGLSAGVPIVFGVGSAEHDAMVGVLRDVMSELSEESYCAGWMQDCEYGIWHELQAGVEDWFIRDKLAIDQLTLLSGMVGGWVIWDDAINDTRFCPMDEWLGMYTTWLAELARYRRCSHDADATMGASRG